MQPQPSRVVPVVSAGMMCFMLGMVASQGNTAAPTELFGFGGSAAPAADKDDSDKTAAAPAASSGGNDPAAVAEREISGAFGDARFALDCVGLFGSKVPKDPTNGVGHGRVGDACMLAMEGTVTPTILLVLFVLLALYITTSFPPVYLFPEAATIGALSALLPLISRNPSATAAAGPVLRQAAALAGGLSVLQRLLGYLFPAPACDGSKYCPAKTPVSGTWCKMSTQLITGLVLFGACNAGRIIGHH